MIKATLIFLLLFSYVDCDKNMNHNRTVKGQTPAPESAPKNASPPVATITLERTGCYGSCPQYTVTIKPDGSTEFDGKKDTAIIGRRDGKITRDDYDRLLQQFDRLDFYSLKPAYENETCPTYSTDQPTAVVSFAISGKTKTVKHYLGCVTDDDKHDSYPPGLKQLEDQIDKAANTSQWIKAK